MDLSRRRRRGRERWRSGASTNSPELVARSTCSPRSTLPGWGVGLQESGMGRRSDRPHGNASSRAGSRRPGPRSTRRAGGARARRACVGCSAPALWTEHHDYTMLPVLVGLGAGPARHGPRTTWSVGLEAGLVRTGWRAVAAAPPPPAGADPFGSSVSVDPLAGVRGAVMMRTKPRGDARRAHASALAATVAPDASPQLPRGRGRWP